VQCVDIKGLSYLNVKYRKLESPLKALEYSLCTLGRFKQTDMDNSDALIHFITTLVSFIYRWSLLPTKLYWLFIL